MHEPELVPVGQPSPGAGEGDDLLAAFARLCAGAPAAAIPGESYEAALSRAVGRLSRKARAFSPIQNPRLR